LDWLGAIIRFLLWLIFGVGALVAVFYTFTAIANLLASPFNGLLAEQVERIQTGRAPDSGMSIWKEVAIAPAQEIRKLLYFLIWAIPLLVLFLIPVINVAAPFVWAAFSAWMLTLQYVDYPLGNRGMRFADQRALMRGNRQLSLGFGAVVLVLTMIPVVNFVAMPAAVVGATFLSLDYLRH
jgi:CysZ protein